MSLPESHIVENEKLEAQAYVDLFQLEFRGGGTFYMKTNSDITWQGDDYTGWALQLDDIAQYASEERSRPTFTVANPEGIFSTFIQDGSFDRAELRRYRILKQHIESDSNVYQLRSFLLWKPKLNNQNIISVELRTPSDGQQFNLPARRFMPPEFSYVSL